jgi:hypothetical protein
VHVSFMRAPEKETYKKTRAGRHDGSFRNWPPDASIMNEEEEDDEEEEDRGSTRSDFRRAEAEAEAEGGNTRDEAEEVGEVQVESMECEVESIECVLADWVCVCMRDSWPSAYVVCGNYVCVCLCVFVRACVCVCVRE